MRSKKSNKHGSTLVIAMFTIAIIAALVGVTLSFTSHNGVLTQREQNFNRAMNAADGALEYAFASWEQSVRDNGLRAPSNSEINIAAPTAALHAGFQSSGVTFSNFSVVNANQWGETTDSSGAAIIDPVSARFATVPGHAGWAGVASFYRARVTALGAAQLCSGRACEFPARLSGRGALRQTAVSRCWWRALRRSS